MSLSVPCPAPSRRALGLPGPREPPGPPVSRRGAAPPAFLRAPARRGPPPPMSAQGRQPGCRRRHLPQLEQDPLPHSVHQQHRFLLVRGTVQRVDPCVDASLPRRHREEHEQARRRGRRVVHRGQPTRRVGAGSCGASERARDATGPGAADVGAAGPMGGSGRVPGAPPAAPRQPRGVCDLRLRLAFRDHLRVRPGVGLLLGVMRYLRFGLLVVGVLLASGNVPARPRRP